MWNELRYALRSLIKNRALTVVTITTLGLGVGANTAVFSLVDAVLLKSLPVREPERLFFVTSGNNAEISYPFIERFQQATADVGRTFAYRSAKVRVLNGPRNEIASAQLVSGNYFQTLGVSALVGRTLAESDDRIGAPPAAVISHACWERRFGRDPAVLGKSITLNGAAFTVVGVIGREFFGLNAQAVPDAFVPIHHHALLNPEDTRLLEDHGSWVFFAVVRLNPGVEESAARARLTTVYQQVISESANHWIRPEHQSEMLARGVRLSPAGQGVAKLREKYSRPLAVLMGAAVLVLLIACSNVGNLLLARGIVRRRELAVRFALGATRSHVTRLLLVESAVLGFAGASLGFLLANWSSRVLLRFLPEDAVGIAYNLEPTAARLAFAMLIGIAATIFFGLVPAIRASGFGSQALGEGNRNAIGGPSVSSLAKWLVVSQVAASFLLLVGAGLFVRTLRELITLNPGFQRANVLVLALQPNLAGYSGDQLDALGSRLTDGQILERLEAIPGVRSASLSSSRQFGELPWWRMPIQLLDTASPSGARMPAAMRWVTPKHFQTYGIPILRGRSFSDLDRANAPKVAIVSETMARAYFKEADPVGQRFKLTGGLEGLGEFEIVGLAKDTRSATLRDPATATFYIPFAQFPNSENLVFALRTDNHPSLAAAAARQVLQAVDSNLAIPNAVTLSDAVDASLVQERAVATLAAAFGGLALLMAALAVYGVLAYAVTQRTREIGVRIALGARVRDIVALVGGQGMKLVGLGILLGLGGALAGSRLLTSLLFGIEPTDTLTFVSVVSLITGMSLFACWLPTRRAMKVEPMEALRHE